MIRSDQPLRLTGAPIIHDTIDNETIVINQQTGSYYSLEGPAAAVWQSLESGTTVARLVEELAARYEVLDGELEPAVREFIGQLLDAGLVMHASDDAIEPGSGRATDAAAPREPFRPLELHHYTDLEVLLLVDPIHEVDETGWPKPLDAPER